MSVNKVITKRVVGIGLVLYAVVSVFLGGVMQINAVDYPLCNKNYCVKTKDHKHGNKTYAGHYKGDGHQTHRVCNKAYCNNKKVHKHGDKKYVAHHKNDKHKTHKKCPVNGCEKTKVHKHNGKRYLGHHKSDGHKHHSNNNGHNRNGCH